MIKRIKAKDFIPHGFHDLPTVNICAFTNTMTIYVNNSIRDIKLSDLGNPSGTDEIQCEETTISLDLQGTLDVVRVGWRAVYQ